MHVVLWTLVVVSGNVAEVVTAEVCGKEDMVTRRVVLEAELMELVVSFVVVIVAVTLVTVGKNQS